MRFDADALGLSPTGTLLLRDLIHDKTGLYFEDGRTSLLLDKLAPLVLERGFDSFLDYYYLLRYDAAAEEEWGQVLNALGVPETYFWREVDQVRAVVHSIVPGIVDRKGSVRIWSVPCASGEEPLSIAMALNEAGLFERALIEVQASDARPAAIEQARAGVYRERSFRALPDDLRRKYFTAQGAEWRVEPGLHSRIAWSVVNLMDRERAGPFASSSIVFCRNLLIYFSEQSLRKTVEMFADLMPVPGYLCLGASESLLRFSTRFHLQEIGGAYIYVKR